MEQTKNVFQQGTALASSFGKVCCENLTLNGKYRHFARLAADWFWELDDQLRYVFHDGKRLSATGVKAESLTGKNRIEVLNAGFQISDELNEHHRCLQNRLPVDIIIPMSAAGRYRHIHVIAEPQFNSTGTFTGYIGCGRDVTHRKQLEAELEHLATHDDLTGVINRREFERKLGVLHEQVKSGSEPYSLCFIDLDRFKHVNDSGGHPAGDQLLRELVGLMRDQLQPNETLARLGGDEFGLLLQSNTTDAAVIADTIIDEIARYNFVWEGNSYRVGASIGIAEITADCESIDALMVRADIACYTAKNNGRNQSHVSDQHHIALDARGSDKVSMINEALQNSRYRLLMQPIVGLANADSFKRYELLVRLTAKNGELLEPGEFMPLAKRYSLLHQLDCWVVENALQALSQLQANGDNVAFSINLSASSLASDDSLARIAAFFDTYDVLPGSVCFDITETYALRNLAAVSTFMQQLEASGVEFALDDFGDGLSSFTYLQNLPFKYLKIDGQLIRKVASDKTVRCITESFHELGRKLGMKTVAESVEDDQTISCLKAIGIDYMQGFGVASLTELDALVTLAPTDDTARIRK